jgi:hypothetical protein
LFLTAASKEHGRHKGEKKAQPAGTRERAAVGAAEGVKRGARPAYSCIASTILASAVRAGYARGHASETRADEKTAEGAGGPPSACALAVPNPFSLLRFGGTASQSALRGAEQSDRRQVVT